MTRWMLCFVVAALGGLASMAGAAEYWITYEGNALPEDEGWNRYWGDADGEYHGDGAIRTVQDGILTMDTLHDPWIYDYAQLFLPGQIDPDPGELFVMEWRLKIDQVDGSIKGVSTTATPLMSMMITRDCVSAIAVSIAFMMF